MTGLALVILMPLLVLRLGYHMAERYGLFTLIVLGKSVASATAAVRTAFDAHRGTGPLCAVAAGGLLTVFAMWWLYFARPAHTLLATSTRGLREGSDGPTATT
ncbi:low temperature requirement protein A [Streptomyces sp. BE133]|uniref:low temperature requirement protein A n=1 Tax=Streptomyces sp. BE133 TaxID=3002523 RepID=UPI002E7A8F1F|nr:low temperature requirement protein A [Streptomyces sp. BE133]MEE1807777.1 low temperature requirement protein A [Streptomyces sp. BE133]